MIEELLVLVAEHGRLCAVARAISPTLHAIPRPSTGLADIGQDLNRPVHAGLTHRAGAATKWAGGCLVLMLRCPNIHTAASLG